ncbi:MAG TPA: hypothetical protein VHC73_06950 [Vitreimonas sp.]|nr:hypothetical protein [Vitreimonas sp.]
MYFGDDEDERDPFEVFGEAETSDETPVQDFAAPTAEEPAVIEPEQPIKVKTGFSWAGFMGGLAALTWIGGAVALPISYFGIDAVMAMDPAMQAGLIALAFGPAMLFWVAASAAGEALKARKLATELTRMAQQARSPIETAEQDAQRLTNVVKTEIEALNDSVATALNRMRELEASAQRNATIFNEALAATRENTDTMAGALKNERDALIELNAEMKDQGETLVTSVGRQVRLMREASKLVVTEITAAEDALDSHMNSIGESAAIMGERTTAFHQAADSAAAATASLHNTMHSMLDSLGEATRLTDAARQSADQAVLAANETATAVRETTRNAVYEAKKAAQLIRAEAAAMQDTAVDTLAKLQEAARVAREASNDSQVAAEQHAASIEKRLGALAATVNAKKAAVAPRPMERVVERTVERPVVAERKPVMEATLQTAASAAVARSSQRQRAETRTESHEPRRVFKGFGGWGNFMPRAEEPKHVEEAPVANDLVDFGTPANDDTKIKTGAIDLVLSAGVDLDDVLSATELEQIAQSSRHGAAARRRTVTDFAPSAVTRIVRHVKRNDDARSVATSFRTRPDLAKSENKREASDLVRAYLLIDAALA